MRESLLPQSSYTATVAVSEALDRLPELMPEFDKIRYDDLYSNPSALNALIVGYGLERVTQFIPSLLFIIEKGIAWQRVIGTPKAVKLGLEWLNYTAALEQSPVWRRKWHGVQLRFPALPANDSPDLGNIEGVVTLSLPARSYLRRGVYLHDIPATETDSRRYDSSIYDSDSGVRLAGSQVKWSFGRSHQFIHTLTEAEGTAIGNWLAPVVDDPAWSEMTFPWTTANFPWAYAPAAARRAALAAWFNGRQLYLAIKDAAGTVLGFRRVRAVHSVEVMAGGAYTLVGNTYDRAVGGQEVYIEAMTGFGDFTGGTAEKVAIRAGATLAPGVKPGRLFLLPNQLTGGSDIMEQTVSIPLRSTVREQFKFLLRF